MDAEIALAKDKAMSETMVAVEEEGDCKRYARFAKNPNARFTKCCSFTVITPKMENF
jgi:hypothetical protein